MVTQRPKDRKLFQMFCNVDRLISSPAWWELEYFETIKCQECLEPKLHYHEAIPQYVSQKLAWTIELMMNTSPNIMRNELRESLSPHLPHTLWGPVYFSTRPDQRVELPYSSWWTPPQYCIVENRNLLACHRLCACGSIVDTNVNAKEAILRRYVDDRLLYTDTSNLFIIDDVLVRSLDLRTKFPDLKFVRLPIIDKPLDGQILPGDPGWNGTITPKPITVLDPDDPESGKWQY
jgi:hypothetical protein